MLCIIFISCVTCLVNKLLQYNTSLGRKTHFSFCSFVCFYFRPPAARPSFPRCFSKSKSKSIFRKGQKLTPKPYNLIYQLVKNKNMTKSNFDPRLNQTWCLLQRFSFLYLKSNSFKCLKLPRDG